MIIIRAPKLHGGTWVCILTVPFSLGDAIGLPQDHIDFAISNEMDALALTDHGNMNGFSHQYMHNKKLQSKGVNFKAIPGVEAYFIPSLREWNLLKEQKAGLSKQLKTNSKIKLESFDSIGDSLLDTKNDLEEISPSVSKEDEESNNGTIVENEEESKTIKHKDPLRQRSHLVLLPKNSNGLKSLFKIVSTSYVDGMFYFPRIDFDILKKECKGDIIALSSCVAGFDSKIIFDNQIEQDWNNYKPNDDNFELIQRKLKDSIEEFKDALGEENYYLELQFNKLGAQHLKNYHIIEAAKRTNTKLVVTCDAHYSNPSHWRERELYKAMAWMSKNKGQVDASMLPQKIEDLKCELYPKNAQQVWKTYLEEKEKYSFYDDDLICDAIERTHEIAHEQIGNVDIDRSVKLPRLNKLVTETEYDLLLKEYGSETAEEDLAFKELIKLAKYGLINRKKHKEQNYIDRLKLELDVIKHLKLSKYFLTYAKIMELTSKEMLLGNARGSAGGSLLSYLLGITQMDPIRFGLLFERFLSKKKASNADIDSDFADRERALEIIREYFGEENVVAVSNFAQLQVASLIKDLSRVYNVPFDIVNQYTSRMRNEALEVAKQEPGFDAAVWQFTLEVAEKDSVSYREFMEFMKDYPEFQEALFVLFKQMKAISRHAGGVVITDQVFENMPVIKSGKHLQSAWPEGLNYRHLEYFGFLKFDVLGLGTLRIFENTIKKIIRKETGKKTVTFEQIKTWFYDKLHPDNNALDDMKVYENVYWNKNYAGVFQFVQENVQEFMAKMKPTNIIDIAIATSLFRPGPLGIGADKLYLKNRANSESIIYKHPLLKNVYKETSGLMVFQEQLQMIYSQLAGVPLDETDSVRKAFTKKDIANKEKTIKDIQLLRDDFIDKCKTVNNIDSSISGDIFDGMEKFVAYSFNKSHAVAYAITSYQCAWFLTYYPDEWTTSYIDYCINDKGKAAGKEDPKSIALKEATRLGYKLGKPDINYSTHEYICKDNVMIPSITSLKNVGKTVLYELDDNRPYKTIEDLLWKQEGGEEVWKHSKFNKRALSALIQMEAFDSMDIVGPDKVFKNYKQMHSVLFDKSDELKKAISRKKNRNHKELLQQYITEVQGMEDWTRQERLKIKKEIAGMDDMSLIVTPEMREFIFKNDIDPIENWNSKDSIYWAIVVSTTVAVTKTEKKYLKIRLKSENGSEIFCNIWNYKASENNLNANDLVVGSFDKNNYGLSTFLSKIYKLNQ